ncbi:hypothetical protein [Pseudomonas chlororaphis]|uniref:hypothetical protein n=1 Tax=Pseudomonas chlororaphis TaxID=587753 RepID=UPI0011D161C6|nr:hypothetical protein [Pseudomonas chlororaphis]
MSNLGLREDRQAARALLVWIVESLPEAPLCGYREQACSYRGSDALGRSELARDKASQPQAGGWVASIDGR